MRDCAPKDFQYPSTRYSGSKRRLLDWIWEHVKDLQFKSVLDVFGGTGSVSLMFKRYGKKVLYNDLLKFNQIIGTAIIENDKIRVTEKDINVALKPPRDGFPDFIQREFQGIFFLDEENKWLDMIVTKIAEIDDLYKRSILMASLFQACLAKRPFNLFHRANLYFRKAPVKRTFGNKTTWEKPFPKLFRKYAMEYNRAIFPNSQENTVVGGYDALSTPNGSDLVYLDPPYFPATMSQGTNYLTFYHFLEGLADYENWGQRINSSDEKLKRIADTKEIQHFIKKDEILRSFEKLLQRFQDSMIVLSYRDDGIPSKDEILFMLGGIGKKVRLFEKPYRYALSSRLRKELLFVAE